MQILNLFIISVILVSLFFKIKFSYLIALLCSLTAATFVYTQESLANILFTIAIFNLTPLACLHFKETFQQKRVSLEKRKNAEQATFEQLSKERSIIRQSNSQLDSELFQIVELYKMTRDMSCVLGFAEIFAILGRKLTEHLRFKGCRMVLIDEEVGALKIKRVWELRYNQAHPRQVHAQTEDVQILKQSLRAQRLSFVEEKSILLVPLIANSKFLGTLAIAGLAPKFFENFSILANQFCLEFKRIRFYQKIEELAITDGLTGLFVRRYFLVRLQEEMERSARHNLQLAFLMVDIDHFKQCNDNFGHLTGDVVLKEVASKIKARVREIDLVARFGGEEFAVLLPDTNKQAASNVAERIRADIDEHRFSAYDETIKIEVSIGLAVYPEDATTQEELIDKSDQALYRAKQEGRNRICKS